MERISKDEYYLNIAEKVSERSTCLQKHWGAVIVKDDVIVSTGFNGAPRKVCDCMEDGYCNLQLARRKLQSTRRGTMYEQCTSVHAEQNALLFADKDKLEGATMYLVGKQIIDLDGKFQYVPEPSPCHICKKLIINAELEKVVVRLKEGHSITYPVDGWLSKNEILGGY